MQIRNIKSQRAGRAQTNTAFRSTFLSQSTTVNKKELKENFKQLKHLVEVTIQESDEKFDKVRNRYSELKQHDKSHDEK